MPSLRSLAAKSVLAHSSRLNFARRCSSRSLAEPTSAPAAPPERTERLDALLSRCGYASRSEALAFLRAGRVSVRGEAARSPSAKASPCDVLVDGLPLEWPAGVTLLLHKPLGCVCSHDSREGDTVFGLLPPRFLRRTPALQSVGRLDRDTTGVLLLSDAQGLVHSLTSPKRKVAKRYLCTLDKPLPADAADVFAAGSIVLDGERCAPARLASQPGSLTAEVTLTEGRYHQVRR